MGTLTKWVLGVALILMGALLLLHTTGIADLGEMVLWIPSLFIALGVVMIISNRFKRIAWPVIMIVVAAVVQLSLLGIDAMIFWPALLIVIGMVILLGLGRRRRRDSESAEVSVVSEGNMTAIMGSSNKRVLPGELGDGEIVVVMGESKLDLRELSAEDLPPELSVTCVMGQVTIRVPAEWSVKISNSTVMGESKDERRSAFTSGDADLTITGSVVMGSLKLDD